MNSKQTWSLFLLRIVLGWLFLYAGYSKIIAGNFSAAGYLKGAATFTGFYHWLAQPGIIGIVNLVNEWGLFLIGVSLILGIGVRLSAYLGVMVMLLYYFPILKFPYPNTHDFIVDEHIIIAAALLVLAAFRAGRAMGLETWFARRFPAWSKIG